ncbi:unnamed protein product [Prorocentrum cordatum]|uniref:Protein xylosyltransferase n=1 Tax=Prorocentrum cordatum TaxID=2364126 RepID=A0ABN9QZV8_9DINO|nr:unnamed protein product [Polarella glacialis]
MMHVCSFLVRVLLGSALTSDGLCVQPSSQDSRARSGDRHNGYGDTLLRTAEGCPSRSIPYNASTCVTDVMDYEYWLPPPDVYNHYMAHEDWSRDQNELWKHITKLQEPAACNNQEWHLIKFTVHGFAYNLYIFVFLAARYLDNRAPVLVGNSKYRLTDTKCGRGYLCTLSPLTQCRMENIDPALVKVTGENPGASDLSTICSPGGKYDVELGGCKCDEGYFPWTEGCSQSPDNEDKVLWQEWYTAHPLNYMRSRDYYYRAPGEANWQSNPDSAANDIPDDSWAEKRSLTWWHAQHLWNFYKDSPETKEMNEWLAAKHMSPSCVSVHVLHNDACEDDYNPWKRCFKFEDYSTQLDVMDRLYGPFEHVYLAADDHAVIEDAQQSRWSSRLIRQGYDRAKYRGNVGNSDMFEKYSATRAIKRDIFAMSKCKAFIGTMSSSIAWVTYELMMARHGHYVAFISLQGAFNDKIIGG